VVVLLGTTTAESSKVFGLTLTEGDPAWAGVLAGVSLNLPVFHITEAEIKQQVDPEIYASEVGLSEMVVDVDEISKAMREVRGVCS
jgi:glycine/sarcosine/betaine reductase complex component A